MISHANECDERQHVEIADADDPPRARWVASRRGGGSVELPRRWFLAAAKRVGSKVTCNAAIQGGVPCIGGTRIPVHMLLEGLSLGLTPRRLMKAYPSLTEETLRIALEYASIALGRR